MCNAKFTTKRIEDIRDKVRRDKRRRATAEEDGLEGDGGSVCIGYSGVDFSKEEVGVVGDSGVVGSGVRVRRAKSNNGKVTVMAAFAAEREVDVC